MMIMNVEYINFWKEVVIIHELMYVNSFWYSKQWSWYSIIK